MKIIKNIKSLPDVEIFASGALLEMFILHNTRTGHTLVKKDDGNWYEGITHKCEYWGCHIDDAAGYHSTAESLCNTPVQAPVVTEIVTGITCYYDTVEESRVFESETDYHSAYIPGIGRVVADDYQTITVYDPNDNPPLAITGIPAEIIAQLLTLITKQ